jgi:hypothetical protein
MENDNLGLEKAFSDIRNNSYSAQELIAKKKYNESINYMKNIINIESKSIFNEVSLNESNEEDYTLLGKLYFPLISINGNDITVVFDENNNCETYNFINSEVNFSMNCLAPAIFEELHHSIQYSRKGVTKNNIEKFNKKNNIRIEKCAYYWRIKIFPENKRIKDEMNKTRSIDFSGILKQKPSSIIKIENKNIIIPK